MFNVCVRLAQLMNYEALDSPNLTVHTNACVCPAQLMNYKYQDPPPPSTSGVKLTPTFETGKRQLT